MGFFSDLFGGGSRRDIDEGTEKARGYITQGYDQGRGRIESAYDKSRRYLEPQLASGDKANAVYESAIGLRGAGAQKRFYRDFQNDPGFQAELAAGNRAVNANAAARGYALSGRALRELQDFGQKHQGQAFDERLDRLAGVVSRGDNTRRGLADMTMQSGRDLAGLDVGEGGTLGNLEVNRANARANTRFTLGDLSGMIGNFAKAYAAF